MTILKGQHWAVIPSRANSQRFPGKALAMLGGITLLHRAVKLSTSFPETIISTNDNDVIKWGQWANYRFTIYHRPDAYAQSDTRIDDTLIEMVNSLEEVPEFLHLIQLTSPFTRASYIEESILILNRMASVDSVQLVTDVPNTYHAFSQRRVEKGRIVFCYPEEREKYYNSQLKPPHYAFAGYVGFRTDVLLLYGTIWGEKSLPIIGGPECAIDIDTPEDLEYAEFILKRKEAQHVASKVSEAEKGHGHSFAQPQ